MTSRSVQISIDNELLSRIDADPRVLRAGRSAFIREACELYLKVRRRRLIDDAIRRAYEGDADDAFEEIVDLIEGQSWPDR